MPKRIVPKPLCRLALWRRLMLLCLALWCGLVLLAVGLAAREAAAEDDLSVLPTTLNGVAPGQMLYTHLLGRAKAALARRDAEYERLKTPEDVAAYQQRMRQFFTAKLGGLPERTPLEARVIGSRQRDGYRIEKVVFQSQPGFFVTAILYLPEAKPPYPAVLVPCGHSANGKAGESYQRAPILMAKSGMAALCFDPIDQGERFQLIDADGKPLAVGTHGHTMLAVGSMLVGRNTATFRVWDGIRAIDYLQSRPEIDPERIGCTGISGGGTMTSYLMALDPRIRAAAPGCYLTTFGRLLETLGPQDGEQNLHAQLAFGMDHADYVIMRAPRPTLLLTATRDYFDIGGSWATFRSAKRIYARLGFPERVDLVEADAQHGFSSELRVAAARWMRRWLLEKDDAITETDSAVLAEEELWCTPRGRVMLLEGARTAYDINLDLEKQLASVRQQFWRGRNQAEALSEVRRIIGIRPLADLPEPRWEKTGSIARDGYRIDKLILRPEPDLWLPALAFVPEKPTGEAVLYVHQDGKHADAAPGGPIEQLVRQGRLTLAVDLVGLGETRTTRKASFAPYIEAEWQEAFLGYLVDRPLLSMRAENALMAARFLAGYETAEGKPNRVELWSVGRTGPAALHAAALEPDRFSGVRLRRCLRSWSDVLRTPMARHQLTAAVHGALRIYDLPDLAATLPPEKLTIEEPLDAEEKPLPQR